MLARRVAGAATVAMCAALAAPASPPSARRPSLPRSALTIDGPGTRGPWWRADRAPTRWAGPLPGVAGAVAWQPVADGIDWGTLRLAGTGEAWRLRVILVRLDPRRVRVRLDTAFTRPGMAAAWTIARAPRDAAVAVNAGQFVGSMPWGWVVLDGRVFLSPGHGPLSTAVLIDSTGRFQWVDGDGVARAAQSGALPRFAFQSYPTLLTGDGDVPMPLRAPVPGGVDLAHRDARLALGELRDGRVIIALTRFDALDGSMDFVPFGLTTPEMAAVMGALGCRRAVALDGGISSQLMLRGPRGEVHAWRGLRKVPLALVATPRVTTGP